MMKNKKELLIIALIGIFIIIIGYLYVIRPIVAFVYFIPEVYDGVELYFDKKYIDFDDGKAFEYALSTVPFFDDERVVAFEYHDNKKSDDLFRGRMCDAYILDLDLGERYKSAIEDTLKIGKKCYSIDDYSVYWLKDSVVNSKNSFFVTFCEETRIIRLIMVTEYKNIESNANVVCDIFMRRFNIDWKA